MAVEKSEVVFSSEQIEALKALSLKVRAEVSAKLDERAALIAQPRAASDDDLDRAAGDGGNEHWGWDEVAAIAPPLATKWAGHFDHTPTSLAYRLLELADLVERARGIAQIAWKEQRRRQTNASRAANADKRAAKAVPAGTYALGEEVEVHSFGRWYRGVVVGFGRTGKVKVDYVTGSGAQRVKAVDATDIRKAQAAA